MTSSRSQDRARRRMAHAVDLLVHRGVLLDIGVGARDIGFGLVVVVIRDEILDRVLGEEALHLGIELRGQCLVGGEDEGRALHCLDHLGHGEGLARAGDAEQDLVALSGADVLDQFLDRGRLVAGGFVFADEDEALAAFGFLRPDGTVPARSRQAPRRWRHAAANSRSAPPASRYSPAVPDHRPCPPARPASPARGTSPRSRRNPCGPSSESSRCCAPWGEYNGGAPAFAARLLPDC